METSAIIKFYFDSLGNGSLVCIRVLKHEMLAYDRERYYRERCNVRRDTTIGVFHARGASRITEWIMESESFGLKSV